MAIVAPQQFGALVPGVTDMSATGTTSDTAALIYAKYSVFTTVAAGAVARLPDSGASNVELVIMPRGGNNLKIIPDRGGQIEGFGVDAPVQVLDGGNATFVCLDPPTRNTPGRQWRIK